MSDPGHDPRALALADFLRSRAALFPVAPEAAHSAGPGSAGSPLLEAADLAAVMGAHDPLLLTMSQRGMFESLPGGTARVLTSDDLGRWLARSILGGQHDGRGLLRDLLESLPPWGRS